MFSQVSPTIGLAATLFLCIAVCGGSIERKTTRRRKLQQSKYCPVANFRSLEEWVSDVRNAAQEASLPAISKTCPTKRKKRKVLLIGIDGLRADAAAMLTLPNFHRLERMGTYSYWASLQKTADAVSGPGWASLLTGVEPKKHKVDSNGDLKEIAATNVLKLVKDKFGKKVAASVSWHPLVTDIFDHQDRTTLNAKFLAKSDVEMARKAETWIKSEKYDLVFADFDACDAAGHAHGFDGYAGQYGMAVKNTDVLVGKLLDAVMEASQGIEWLIVLTTDHGGKDTSHGGYGFYNRKVPLMVASNSPRVRIGRAAIKEEGSHMDVVPTIMHFLGGKKAIPKNLDGQPFGFKDFKRTRRAPCGHANVNQADYRGNIAKTISGKTCQNWSSQKPHEHDRTPENYPYADLRKNYCRNPDNEDWAWCYTTDGNTRFERCDVPYC